MVCLAFSCTRSIIHSEHSHLEKGRMGIMAFVLHDSGATCRVSLVQGPAPTVEDDPGLHPVSAIWEELSCSVSHLAKFKESDKECGLWMLHRFFGWLPVYLNLVVTLQSQAFNYELLMADLTGDISANL